MPTKPARLALHLSRMAFAGTVSMIVLAAGGGCAETRPAMPPLHLQVGADRREHVRELLRDLTAEGGPEEVEFGGGSLSTAGIEGLCVYLALWVGLETDDLAPLVARACRSLRSVESLTHQDLCVGLMSMALLDESLRTRGGRDALKMARAEAHVLSRGLLHELCRRQSPDGRWGDWASTAWSLSAIRMATLRLGPDRELGAATRERFERGLPAELEGDIDSIYRVAAFAAANDVSPWTEMDDVGFKLIEELLPERPVDLGCSPARALAYALSWLMLGPSRSSSHPIANAKNAFRKAYESRRVYSEDMSARIAHVIAVEWLGYDDFGARVGYLPMRGFSR